MLPKYTRVSMELFFSPNKLARLCQKMNPGYEERSQQCSNRHGISCVSCQTVAVYLIPLSCWSVCAGRTGRCVNDRVREGSVSSRDFPAGHLAAHAHDYRCEPDFSSVLILEGRETSTVREIQRNTLASPGVLVTLQQPS